MLVEGQFPVTPQPKFWAMVDLEMSTLHALQQGTAVVIESHALITFAAPLAIVEMAV